MIVYRSSFSPRNAVCRPSAETSTGWFCSSAAPKRNWPKFAYTLKPVRVYGTELCSADAPFSTA